MGRVVIIGTVASSLYGFRSGLIHALVSSGAEVFAFAVDYNDESRRKVAQLGATPVEYRLDRTGINPISDLFSTLSLAIALRKLAPDVVFSYLSKPVIFGTLAAALARVPRRVGMLEGLGYVFTDHPAGVSSKIKLLRAIQLFLYRVSFLFLDKIILLNEDDKRDLSQKYRLHCNSFFVLGAIGLNLSKYPYSVPPQDACRFIFVGRLLAEKGIYDFIAAARKVKALWPCAEFIVAGGIDSDNPGSIKLSELEELVGAGVVNYIGQVDDIVRWLASSSVFVLPSYYREGVPRSTQEAMAIGRPIITTDSPGCRDTVQSGINGFLVPRWEPDDIADKMVFFIENPKAVVEMGLRSHELAVASYDEDKINKKLIAELGL